MKKLLIISGVIILLFQNILFGQEDIEFDQGELDFIIEHKDRDIHIGLAPYEGIDLFIYEDKEYGYLFEVAKIFQEATGLSFVVDKEKSWGQAYSGLFSGDNEVLFGANATEERLKIMSFTKAIKQYPYVVLAKNSELYTIGDLHQQKIGFIDGDMVIALFEENYKNIVYSEIIYDNPQELIESIANGQIEGGITANTEIVDELLFSNQSVNKIAELKDLTSDMTFSTLKENEVLASILDKVITANESKINEHIRNAGITYTKKLLQLSDIEKEWLNNNKSIRVGVANDYVPIDYYDEELGYVGVAGVYLTEFTSMLGIEIIPIPGTFDELYKKIEIGEIDVLNMAKTEGRMDNFVFTDPFSLERDMIYGLKDIEPVYDIYGLEKKRIAVVEGFWHEEYLSLNLRNVTILKTADIEESLDIIEKGQADYFIENPTVADYYIEGLGYTTISTKGVTSADSFLSFGAIKKHETMIGIFNRSIPLIDYEEAKYLGVQTAPLIKNKKNSQLTIMLLVAFLVLVIAAYVIIRLIRSTIRNRTETEVLKEREHLMFKDALTGLNNRAYYNKLENHMDDMEFPQSFIMLDLNMLKVTNDTYGHQGGDKMIFKFGELLLEVFSYANVMRMGGDEFFVFLSGEETKKVESLIDKLSRLCNESIIDVGNNEFVKGPFFSWGSSLRNNAMVLPRMAMHDADQKMYRMKKNEITTSNRN